MDMQRIINRAGGQSELARLLGVSRQMVWQWANGSPVSPEKFKALQDVMPDFVKPSHAKSLVSMRHQRKWKNGVYE